jgi:transglutaminase-like putative cysteine protease
MVITIVILSVAALGFLIALILLIRELLPKDKPTSQALQDMAQKSQDQIDQAAKQGQEYVTRANKLVEAADAFASIFVLPAALSGKVRNLITKSRHTIETADALTKKPDLFLLLATVSPASNEIYGELSDNYVYIITEDLDEPFQVSQEIVTAANNITTGAILEEEKARALYDWFVAKIPFGTSGWKKHQKSMRHAKEIFEDREGVCAEMTILYIVMARAVGLEAKYARTETINSNGQVERHACPYVKVNGKWIFVDPGFQQFDAPHKGYKIMSDQEAVPHFKSLRNKPKGG